MLRRSAVLVGVGGIVATLFSPVMQTAVAAPGDGTLTVTVIRDVNGDGARTATLEPGLAGVEVVLTDLSGAQQTLTTNASGQVTVAGAAITLTGGKYRVEVKNPKPGILYSATAATSGTPSSTAMSSNEEFVDVSAGKNVSMLTGFWNPADYCQNNPTIVNSCQPGMNTTGSGWLTGAQTIFTANYELTGGPSQVTTNDVTGGGVYGQGVRRPTATSTDFRLFTGAYAKRGSNYSQHGGGAIFVSSAASSSSPLTTPTLFTTVPNVGSTQHSVANGSEDVMFRYGVGKESLGDVDVSDDGRYLFAVNMFDKQLYVYNASDTSGAAPVLKTIPIPATSCASAGEWRPMGLGERDGLLYVGGVCDTSLTAAVLTMTIGTASDLSDMAFTGQTVLQQSLNYARQEQSPGAEPRIAECHEGIWHAWSDDLGGLDCRGGIVSWAQPLLADIEFRNDGAMMVSFRDRSTDQQTQGIAGTPPSPVAEGEPFSYTNVDTTGDLLLACSPGQNGQGYIFDVNGGCPNDNPKNSWGEFFQYDQRFGFEHTEAYFGGIVYVPTQPTVVSNVLDPDDQPFNNGMAGTNVKTPDRAGDLLVTARAGKGAGLADIEALCDNAPLQIGNRVWFDANRDGVQGADEVPLAGVTVQLIKNGTVIGTRVTNARGEYYFSTKDTDLGGQFVPHGGDYTIKFIAPTTGTVNLGGATGTRPWADLTFTNQGVGSNSHIDSNPNPADGTFVYTAGGPGQNDHTIDAGYIIALPATPTFGKTSDPLPGTVVKPGDTVTYTVTAVNPSATQPITTGTLTDNMAAVLDKATLDPAGAVPVLTCVGPAGATCGAIVFNATAKTVVWTATPASPLSPATTARITYTVKLNVDDPSTPANEAAVGTLGNVLVEPDIHVEHPILITGKESDPATGTRVNPGDTVNYTIWFENTGDLPATAQTFTDDLSAVLDKAKLIPDNTNPALTITSILRGTPDVPGGAIGTAVFDGTAGAEKITWTGDIPAHTRVSVTYGVVVNADDPATPDVDEGAFGELQNVFLEHGTEHPVSATLAWNKVDAETTDLLEGSVWKLTPVDANGDVDPTRATIDPIEDCVAAAAADCLGPDKDPAAGKFRIPGLVPGAYQLEELEAPDGYVLLAAPIDVTVRDDASVTVHGDIENEAEPTPVSLRWQKVDASGIALIGSEWKLTPVLADGSPDPSRVEIPLINDCYPANAACNGIDQNAAEGGFQVDDLLPGLYDLTETKAPAGFQQLPAPVRINVADNGTFTEIDDIVNEQNGVPTLPLTGGLGSDSFWIVGGAVGLFTVALLAWFEIRSRRSRATAHL